MDQITGVKGICQNGVVGIEIGHCRRARLTPDTVTIKKVVDF